MSGQIRQGMRRRGRAGCGAGRDGLVRWALSSSDWRAGEALIRTVPGRARTGVLTVTMLNFMLSTDRRARHCRIRDDSAWSLCVHDHTCVRRKTSPRGQNELAAAPESKIAAERNIESIGSVLPMLRGGAIGKIISNDSCRPSWRPVAAIGG